MEKQLTLEEAQALIGHVFVYKMPFNQLIDVSAGLVCVGNALTRLAPISQEQLEQKLANMGTIDLRVDYLRPGRGECFTASSHILRSGNKVSVARVELHNEKQVHIASGTATYIVG